MLTFIALNVFIIFYGITAATELRRATEQYGIGVLLAIPLALLWPISFIVSDVISGLKKLRE